MNIKSLREKNKPFQPTVVLNNSIKAFYFGLTYLLTPISFLLKCLGVRVLDVKFEALGHLAIEPDLYIREQKLLNKRGMTILFPPYTSLIKEKSFSSSVCNRFLLRCWKDHFVVLNNVFLYVLLYPILKSSLLRYNPYHYLAIKHSLGYQKNFDYASIYNEFQKEFCGNEEFSPLIRLKDKDIKRGNQILRKMGIPENAWYICFNCRESGYYSENDLKKTSCRNYSIENLEAALEEVMRQGGWCIRLGSPLTPPLPSSLSRHARIIDYPHTKYVSEFMDIFLPSRCTFFLGTNSGITVMAGVLGKPCVWTNVIPFGMLSPFSQDISIFKLFRDKTSQKLVPFSDCLRSHLSISTDNVDYDEFQIELVENSPEEIRDATLEMLNRLEGRYSYSDLDEELQLKFRSLMSSFNFGQNSKSRIGTKFLHTYRELLS